jgi:hypothetical protein
MNIYLSPHHDDVCFSISHFAHAHGGELLNLFTVSSYLAASSGVAGAERAPVETITERRRLEDLRFVQACGLRSHDLGLSDVPDDADPFDLTDIEAEVDLLSERLIPYLLDLLPQDSDANSAALYCPMGIGGHRNHVSTLRSIQRAYADLSKRCAIWLYEELYYASIPSIRNRDVAAARATFADRGLLPMIAPLSAAEMEMKLRWIGFYESQLDCTPQADQYIPASDVSPWPHESIWRVLPQQLAASSAVVEPARGWSPLDGRYQPPTHIKVVVTLT